MSDALVIRLLDSNDDQPTAQWLLVDTAGGRLGVVLDGALNEAAALALGKKVIVLVPGAEVNLSEPVLPVKRGAQLEQVMRYALEENLASDLDDLHFAMSKRQANGSTPVAVVEHNRMSRWLAALADANIHADALYSEASVLPVTPGICIVIDRNVLYIKRGNAIGTALDVQPLDAALQLVLSGEETPTDALVYLNQAEFEAHSPTLDACRERIPTLQTMLLPEGPLPLFALQAVQVGAANLLAGQYARKKSWNKTLAPWRFAAMLTAAVFVLHLTTSGLRFWQLTRAEKQVDQQIREVVTQTLPGTQLSDTRKARQQFESRLEALRASGGSTGFLSSLHALASTLEEVPDVRIDALAYRPKIIDLRITAPNVDALAHIQQLVNEQGLHAEIQSATPRADKVEGRLQVTSPGA